MAEEIDNDFGVRIVKMVAVLVVQASKTFPSLLSTELREGGADLAGLAARLEAVQSMPLAGSKIVTGAMGIGQSALLALNMLCELEDSLGVQGLNPDWHTRNREYQTRMTFPQRVDRVIETVASRGRQDTVLVTEQTLK